MFKRRTVSGVKTTLTLNNNCVVKARIRNSISEIKTATLDVTNVDRLAPNTFTPIATTTSNSITVTGSTTDKPGTEKYGSSGIAEYYFSKDNGTSWQTNEDKTQTSYTYTELTQGTEYTIKMKAIDKAGNETITESITATTINIANLGDIQISATPSTPTNKDVTVTVTWPSNTTGLIKKISKDNGANWSDYTGPITVSSNCIVKAKLIDTTSQEGKTATANITNIDKTNPTVTAKQSSVTITEGASNALSNYFTITANGRYGISSTIYTDPSDSNAQVTNTNTLKVGTHTIKCTATKETGATENATITIVVEESGPKVDENGLAKENTTIKPDKNSNLQIVIPTGFAPAILQTGTTQSLPGQDGSVKNKMPASQWNNITAEDINKGIVVVDAEGNEFVWIPITDASKFARTAWTTGSSTTPQTLSKSAYWEDTTTTEYTKMVTSVTNNKGFYVARYEASANSDSSKAQSKRGATAWISISQIDAITKVANYNSALHSHLMYGIEWDSILNWLKGNATISSSTKGETKPMELTDLQTNSCSWGNYRYSTGNAATNKGSPPTTGKSEYWKANNIYDLAGNVSEWTQEKHSTGTYRAFRGGNCYGNGDEYPAAYRSNSDASNTFNGVGFRSSFYL